MGEFPCSVCGALIPFGFGGVCGTCTLRRFRDDAIRGFDPIAYKAALQKFEALRDEAMANERIRIPVTVNTPKADSSWLDGFCSSIEGKKGAVTWGR